MKLHSLKIGLVALCHATIQEKYACESCNRENCLCCTSIFPYPCLQSSLTSWVVDEIKCPSLTWNSSFKIYYRCKVSPQKGYQCLTSFLSISVTTQCGRRWGIFCSCCSWYSKQLLELCKHKIVLCRLQCSLLTCGNCDHTLWYILVVIAINLASISMHISHCSEW